MRNDEPTKAQLYCLDQSESITFQFNPTSFKFTRKVTWAEGKNAGQPWTNISFSFGGNDSLSVSLLLDETESDDDEPNDATVLEGIIDFYKLTMPLRITDGEDEVIRPPVVAFLWEQFQFQGVVQNMDVELLMFDETGRAKRATVALTLLGKAMSGASSAQEFFALDYTHPEVDASSSGSDPDSDERLDILDEL